MKKLLALLTLGLTISCAFAHPQDGMSPDELMRYYVKVFNEENISALEQVYHFPHIKIRNGKLTRFDNTAIPVIDYSELKKSGWKYSKINKIIVLAEGENSALVEMDFSRYDKDDKEFLRSTGYYVLTKNMGYWQILSLNSIGSVAGATSNKLFNRSVSRRPSSVVLNDTSSTPPTLIHSNPARRRKWAVSDPSDSLMVMTQCRVNRHLVMRPATGRSSNHFHFCCFDYLFFNANASNI